MSENLVKQILIGARSLIEDEAHWIKGEEKIQDTYCAVGAVKGAVIGLSPEPDDCAFFTTRWPLYGEARVDAFKALAKNIPKLTINGFRHQIPSDQVICFNDLPETTHVDILRLFDRAIGE